MEPCGLLNLNKPAGVGSRRLVDLVQHLARPAKAGHAGTLDPLAEGVLLVCVGSATRLMPYLHRLPKKYLAAFLLGCWSRRDDVEEEVVETPNAPVPTLEQVRAAAAQYIGRYEQRPPVFSAVKVAGRRAYKLARKGHAPELRPKPVEIYRLTIVQYQYPCLSLEIECSGGTYVRALGRDLAHSLGTTAVMSALKRLAIGDFCLEEAVEPARLSHENWQSHLEPPLQAVARLPRVQLSKEQVRRLAAGQRLALAADFNAHSRQNCQEIEVAALDEAGRLAAILVPDAAGRWRAKLKLFPTTPV